MITALALIIGTRDLVPFTVGLLAMALATEMVVCLGRPLSVRIIPGIAADFAGWLLVDLMTFPEGVSILSPIGATMIIAVCLVVVIYGGSIGLRTFGLRYRIMAFEIAQTAGAFGLQQSGAARHSRAAAVGVFFLLLRSPVFGRSVAVLGNE